MTDVMETCSHEDAELQAMWRDAYQQIIASGNSTLGSPPALTAAHTCYVTRRDGRIVACGVYIVTGDTARNMLGWTLAEMRRTGIYDALVEFANVRLRALGVRRVILHTSAEAAEQFCIKRGDRKIATWFERLI